jgi:hypothetical protein
MPPKMRSCQLYCDMSRVLSLWMWPCINATHHGASASFGQDVSHIPRYRPSTTCSNQRTFLMSSCWSSTMNSGRQQRPASPYSRSSCSRMSCTTPTCDGTPQSSCRGFTRCTGACGCLKQPWCDDCNALSRILAGTVQCVQEIKPQHSASFNWLPHLGVDVNDSAHVAQRLHQRRRVAVHANPLAIHEDLRRCYACLQLLLTL